MSLQVPDYIIDERLVTAIRRNVISYLTSYFGSNPKNITLHYFHLSTKTDTGIFEKLFYSPTKYILTPVGFAVLYDCEKSLEYLLKRGANPNISGIAVDCPVEDIKLRWKIDLFRLHEVYPVCLTIPNSKIFGLLVKYGLKLSLDYKLRFRLVTMEETKERIEISRGVWELAWIFWIQMRNPEILMKTTESLIDHGMCSTFIMERVNLLPLLKKIYKLQKDDIPNSEEASYIIDLMKVLLYNGCDFDSTKLIEYIYPCINIFFQDSIIINTSLPEIINRYKIIQGISNLSKIFQKILNDKQIFELDIPYLSDNKFLSLQILAIYVIRKCLTGVLFSRKLAVLNIDTAMKEVIQNVIPISQNSQFISSIVVLKSDQNSGSIKQKGFSIIEESNSTIDQ